MKCQRSTAGAARYRRSKSTFHSLATSGHKKTPSTAVDEAMYAKNHVDLTGGNDEDSSEEEQEEEEQMKGKQEDMEDVEEHIDNSTSNNRGIATEWEMTAHGSLQALYTHCPKEQKGNAIHAVVWKSKA